MNKFHEEALTFRHGSRENRLLNEAADRIEELEQQLVASREFALSLWTDENELFEQAYRETGDE